MDDLISEFIEETNESLSLLDQELVRFEQDPSDKDILSNIFRVMHTIKGTCGFLGLPRLERVAHAGEDVLGKFRDGTLEVTPNAVSLILKCLDQIGSLLSNLSETGEEGPATPHEEELIGDLRAMADGEAGPAADETGTGDSDVGAQAGVDSGVLSPEDFPVAAEFLQEFEDATKGDAADAPTDDVEAEPDVVPDQATTADVTVLETAALAPTALQPSVAPDSAKKKDRPAAAAQSIRVNVEVLENLMTMVSEMVLTRNQLLQLTRAEVIMNPTASTALPEDNNFDIPIVTTMARRVRAYENLAFVLLSNLGPYGNDPKPPHARKQPSQIIDFKGNMLAGSQTGGQEIVTAVIDINAQRKARTSLGGGNLLAALQTQLYRQTYEADFAPVNALLENPIQETLEHNEALRQTISELVERGLLVAPGV